jgi:clan AA aspartic protease
MSTFEWSIDIGTPQGDYFEMIAALVDTGSSLTFVPREMLERLGVEPTDREEFELANGKVEVREVGETRVRLEGRVLTTKVGFGEPGDNNILGAYTLEGAGLAVDPVNQRLIPVRRRWL